MTPPGFNLRAGGLIVVKQQLELEANDDAFGPKQAKPSSSASSSSWEPTNKESNFHTFKNLSSHSVAESLLLVSWWKISVISTFSRHHDSIFFSKTDQFYSFCILLSRQMMRLWDLLKVKINNVCVSQRRLRESFKKLASRALGSHFHLLASWLGVFPVNKVMTQQKKGQQNEKTDFSATLSVKFRFLSQWHLRTNFFLCRGIQTNKKKVAEKTAWFE